MNLYVGTTETIADAALAYGIGRMPLLILRNMRAAGGKVATPMPLPPPRMLPAASNTTVDSSTSLIVRVGWSFWTSPSTEPHQPGSTGLGSTRIADSPGLVWVAGPLLPISTTTSRREIGAPP